MSSNNEVCSSPEAHNDSTGKRLVEQDGSLRVAGGLRDESQISCEDTIQGATFQYSLLKCNRSWPCRWKPEGCEGEDTELRELQLQVRWKARQPGQYQ